MNNEKNDIREEIVLFREKLGSLLEEKPLDCKEVLDMSAKLDTLINRYYLQNSIDLSTKHVM